jgi:hypothetical protein
VPDAKVTEVVLLGTVAGDQLVARLQLPPVVLEKMLLAMTKAPSWLRALAVTSSVRSDWCHGQSFGVAASRQGATLKVAPQGIAGRCPDHEAERNVSAIPIDRLSPSEASAVAAGIGAIQ